MSSLEHLMSTISMTLTHIRHNDITHSDSDFCIKHYVTHTNQSFICAFACLRVHVSVCTLDYHFSSSTRHPCKAATSTSFPLCAIDGAINDHSCCFEKGPGQDESGKQCVFAPSKQSPGVQGRHPISSDQGSLN